MHAVRLWLARAPACVALMCVGVLLSPSILGTNVRIRYSFDVQTGVTQEEGKYGRAVHAFLPIVSPAVLSFHILHEKGAAASSLLVACTYDTVPRTHELVALFFCGVGGLSQIKRQE